ncbi:MAG: cell division protein SepF [Eubacteriales bacterium]
MAALNLFAKQNKQQREEDYDTAYYGAEEEAQIPETDQTPAFEKPTAPARSTYSPSGGAPTQMKLIRPTCYADGEIIAGYLKDNHPVFMHFENINKEDAHDLVRFLDGVLFAIEGHLQPVSENTFILTPSGMEVAEEKLNEEENPVDVNEGYGFAGFGGVGGYGY